MSVNEDIYQFFCALRVCSSMVNIVRKQYYHIIYNALQAGLV